MYNTKHLTILLIRRGPRTHTRTHAHTNKWTSMGLQSVEPGRGTCLASCGHTDPNLHGGTRTNDLGIASTKTADRSTTTTDHAAITTRTADRSRTTILQNARREPQTVPQSPRSSELPSSPQCWSRQPHSFSFGGRGFFSPPLAS